MITLDAEHSLRIEPKGATRIACVSGVLWVTCEGDPRDFFLAHGELLEVDHGLTIATALEPAMVSVTRSSLRSRLRTAISRIQRARRWQ